MARYKGSILGQNPKISNDSVKDFFNERAKKINDLDELRAVMYQDENPNLVMERNKAEKNKLLPYLNINHDSNIVDVGCGTGRWLECFNNQFNSYYGIDLSKGFIEYSRKKYEANNKVHFEELSATDLKLDRSFNRLLCIGLLIYINDNDLKNLLKKFNKIMDDDSILVFREPVGINYRLTLDSEFSKDLKAEYSAIYRTKNEIIEFFKIYLTRFDIKNMEPLFDSNLNNRIETQQYYFVLGK